MTEDCSDPVVIPAIVSRFLLVLWKHACRCAFLAPHSLQFFKQISLHGN